MRPSSRRRDGRTDGVPVSFHQLADASIPYVILGHSERRALFHEGSTFVGKKTAAALECGLSVIACVGEQLKDREAGHTSKVVREQLEGIRKGINTLKGQHGGWKKVVIAYEPVWAIGTGKVATPEQAQEAHKDIRAWIAEAVGKDVAEETRIIYGGSVNPKNCGELCPSASSLPLSRTHLLRQPTSRTLTASSSAVRASSPTLSTSVPLPFPLNLTPSHGPFTDCQRQKVQAVSGCACAE